MKVAVLLSGGVDSSVALALLKRKSHDITAYYIKIWLEDEMNYLGACPWEEDLAYAESVCRKLGVPLKVVSLQKEYYEKVVKYTISEVKKGHTPNPDVMCNNRIKFGMFLELFGKKYDKIATGHYSQIVKYRNRYYLKQAPDPIKDQTYFLANLNQNQLEKSLFPIGHLNKSEVRKLAEELDLPNKNRKDSQGICFLGKLRYSDFVKHYLGIKKGRILEYETKKKLGEHEGYWFYTLGQRKDIKLSGGPWYVTNKDKKNNIIYVSKSNSYSQEKRDVFKITDFNWFSGHSPDNDGLRVKLRHGEKTYKATIIKDFKSVLHIKIDSNDQGLAPGQFAVFYKKNRCLGSGVICE